MQEAGAQLGISTETARAWRRRLGVPNTHVLHASPPSHVRGKGLTQEIIMAVLRAHPGSRQATTLLAHQVGCSRQAVRQKLVRLERHGLVRAVYSSGKYRQGWVVVENVDATEKRSQ